MKHPSSVETLDSLVQAVHDRDHHPTNDALAEAWLRWTFEHVTGREWKEGEDS